MKVNVSLVPVSIRAGSKDSDPQLVALQVGGAWPALRVRGSVRESVQILQESLPSELQPVLRSRAMEAQQVTFFEADGELTLVYSTALPMPMGDVELADGAWVDLLRPAARHVDARKLGDKAVSSLKGAKSHLEWWKEFLEEKAGVLAFLPEFFTARQARDVYGAVWGYHQDADSFAKWSGIGTGVKGQLTPWVEKVSTIQPGSLSDRFIEVAHDAQGDESDVARSLAAEAVAKASRAAVGLDPSVTTAGLAPHVLFTAASLVAFQRQGVRGPKPAWFRQRDADLTAKLPELYTPRPTWAYPSTKSG